MNVFIILVFALAGLNNQSSGYGGQVAPYSAPLPSSNCSTVESVMNLPSISGMTEIRRFQHTDSGGRRMILQRSATEWAYVGIVPVKDGGEIACVFLTGRSARFSATESDLDDFESYQISCLQLRRSLEDLPFSAGTVVTTRKKAKEAAFATLAQLPNIAKQNGWDPEKLRQQSDLVRIYANSIDILGDYNCQKNGDPLISFRKFYESMSPTNEIWILDNVSYVGTAAAAESNKIVFFVSRSSISSDIGRSLSIFTLNRNFNAAAGGSGYQTR